MKIDSDNISEEIQNARPNVKPNTIKQYEVNLKKLQKIYGFNLLQVMREVL